MKKISLLLIISCFIANLWSQKEGNIWYFGTNAGVSFNSGSPVALTDGMIAIREGCSSISDKNGNILFYTDGQKVYDKTHAVMPNGSGLLGHKSSCQSAIIVPWPDSTGKYFIVTSDAIENTATNGIRYSVVDLKLNSGLGDVVSAQKNVVLIKPQCEKITLVRHYNKKDFWLVTNQSSSDSILSFAVTATGINKKAIRSNTGISLSGDLNNNLGYLNPSHDGSKLASCHFMMDMFMLMDFNNQTGKVSNVKSFSKAAAYCAEFSPNNKILYVSGLRYPTAISQYDISSNTQNTIQSSVKEIFDYGSGEMGALKLGPDGKIYATSETTTNGYNTYLGAIKYPNSLDTNCSFNPKALYLGGKATRLGLPNNFDFFINISDLKNTELSRVTKSMNLYPNPASGKVNIQYSTQNTSDIRITLLNILGEEINTLSVENQTPGDHTFQFETSKLDNGIYLIRLLVGTQTTVRKFTVVK